MPCSRKLQEVRRHLRHLQDSGPRVPGSRQPQAQASPPNKVAASSSQTHPTICTPCASIASHICQFLKHSLNRQYIYYATRNRQTLPRCSVSLGSLMETSMALTGSSGSVSRPNSPMRMAPEAVLTCSLAQLGHKSSDAIWSLRVCRNSWDRRRASGSLGLSVEQMWLN